MKKVITPMQITAADSNSRTISGRIVTFEETGNASIGKVQFAAGSIEPTAVLLNLTVRVELAKHFQLNQAKKELTRLSKSLRQPQATTH
jgi:hypothetical protein